VEDEGPEIIPPPKKISVAAWNVNNRVGRTTFRPEAARAAMLLDVDVILFNEFFAAQHLDAFTHALAQGGWKFQLISAETATKANRILAASRLPISKIELPIPPPDDHVASNSLALLLPNGAACLAVRVPA